MKKEKTVLWMSIILAALSIVPLLWISFYDHPSADDYDYAFRTYAAWKSGRSLGLVLKEAVLTSAEFWHKWQGLYTSAFLLALEPAIFGEQYYCITGFLTIGTLVCANLLFFDDITEDITDWRNGNVTEYYGLNSVRLSDE